MWRLFYTLRYFRLRNGEKRSFDLFPTIGFAILLAAPYWIVPGASFFRPNGMIDKLLVLTSCLTGFYVAALVAAATFQHPDLDKVITAGPIGLVTKGMDGKKLQEQLSRRQFACYIFGYLSFLSMMISIAFAFGISMSGAYFNHNTVIKTAGIVVSDTTFTIARDVIIFAYTIAMSNLVVVTSLGLYYMMDRLYRKNRTITTQKRDESEDEAA